MRKRRSLNGHKNLLSSEKSPNLCLGFFIYTGLMFFSKRLCIHKMIKPKAIELIIKQLFSSPSTEKDKRIRMVEIMNPEFLITL